jgi:hypothetical protein
MSSHHTYLVPAEVLGGYVLPSPDVLKTKRDEAIREAETTYTKQLLIDIDRTLERYAKCQNLISESNIRKRKRVNDSPHLRVMLYNARMELVDRLIESIRTKSNEWTIRRDGRCIHFTVAGAPNDGSISGSEDEEDEDDEIFVAPHSESESESESPSESESETEEPDRKKTKQ